MIRIDALWLATAPLDMRAGPDKALGRVVVTCGSMPFCVERPCLISLMSG